MRSSRRDRRHDGASGRLSAFFAPAVLGIATWLAFPTMMAEQDISAMLSGSGAGEQRWTAAIEVAKAGSVHKAELPFVSSDRITTGSISGAGVKAPGIGEIAVKTKGGETPETPDEARINRSEKRDRIVKVSPVAPPKSFNAGSIVERRASLLRPSLDAGVQMAFVKPKIAGEEIKIASTFYKRHKPAPQLAMPAVVAALVNNETPDVLATAYAPAEPNYAKTSPFASLLKDKDKQSGRFIPPIAKNDHAWAAKPLPAAAFSAEEQQCLAAGIYFEARGELAKGQAAVAQVILNRVRNPDYPNTICGVVYQNQSWRNRCQFSFACDGIRDRIASPHHWKVASEIALAVTAGKIWIPEVGSSTHYHATYVNPRWAHYMKRMKKIGRHIFYRTYGGGWS